VEPLAELPEAQTAAEREADWGGSVGAAILVSLATLIGVVLAVPGISTFAKANAEIVEGLLAAFAAGALLACAFFLLLFESTHLIAEGWKEEVDVLWRWGAMVLAGFLLPAVFESAFMAAMTAMGGRAPAQPVDAGAEDGASRAPAQVADAGAEGGADAKETVAGSASRARVIGAVIIGDFMHNFCDGIFIGAAFKGCGGSFAWGVAMGTILHELPQELADYAILTGAAVKMRPLHALLLNFVAGLSVILGTVVVNASDLDDGVVGLLLALGGGTYVYLAAVECMPKVHQLKLALTGNFLCLFSFVVGAVLIGLILLDHKHCVPDGSDGHGGHHHRL